MDTKSILSSTEVISGAVLVVMGALALASGYRDIFTMAMIPFGAGLILSDIAARIAKATKDRVKIRIRRDGK